MAQPVDGFVCFCKICKAIIGDHLSCVEVTPEHIVLSKCRVARKDIEMKVSSEGLDRGSSYQVLLCECNEELGKYYVSSPSELVSLRENFCFDSNHVDTYTIGDSKTNEFPKPAELSHPVSILDNIGLLTTELYKVNRVLIHFNQRLEQVEKLNKISWN